MPGMRSMRPAASCWPSWDTTRACGRSPSRRSYSRRSVRKRRASRSAWSAAPSDSAVHPVRVHCSALSTVSRPPPAAPTSAWAGIGAATNSSPLMSAPLMPCVGSFASSRVLPGGRAALSTRKRLKPRGPPAGAVRASTQMNRPRVALLIGHLRPSSRHPVPSRVAVTPPASRSLPLPASVSPQATASPAMTCRASWAACAGPPATQIEAAPRNVLPCATATVRSIAATCRSTVTSSSSRASRPPSAAGTYQAGRSSASRAAHASAGKPDRSSRSRSGPGSSGPSGAVSAGSSPARLRTVTGPHRSRPAPAPGCTRRRAAAPARRPGTGTASPRAGSCRWWCAAPSLGA